MEIAIQGIKMAKPTEIKILVFIMGTKMGTKIQEIKMAMTTEI